MFMQVHNLDNAYVTRVVLKLIRF